MMIRLIDGGFWSIHRAARAPPSWAHQGCPVTWGSPAGIHGIGGSVVVR